MQCEILPTNKNHDREKTLTYFTTLYTIRKLYSEDRAEESGFGSVANIIHIFPEMSVDHASINPNRVIMIGTLEDEAKISYYDYVKVLE